MSRYRALMSALLFFLSLAGQAQLGEQRVSGNGVMVTVTPGDLPASAQVWEPCGHAGSNKRDGMHRHVSY